MYIHFPPKGTFGAGKLEKAFYYYSTTAATTPSAATMYYTAVSAATAVVVVVVVVGLFPTRSQSLPPFYVRTASN